MHNSFKKSMDSFTIQKKRFTQPLRPKKLKKLTKPISVKTAASRKPDQDSLRGKWVYNLSSKPLTSVGKSPLQKGPKFAITLSSIPTIEYITPTKHICDSLGEITFLEKKDCTEYYAKDKDVLTKFRNKLKPIVPNITKEERKAPNNLKKMTSAWSLLPTKEWP